MLLQCVACKEYSVGSVALQTGSHFDTWENLHCSWLKQFLKSPQQQENFKVHWAMKKRQSVLLPSSEPSIFDLSAVRVNLPGSSLLELIHLMLKQLAIQSSPTNWELLWTFLKISSCFTGNLIYIIYLLRNRKDESKSSQCLILAWYFYNSLFSLLT